MNSLTDLQQQADLESVYTAESVDGVLAAYTNELRKVCGAEPIVVYIGKHGGDHKVIYSDISGRRETSIVSSAELDASQLKSLPLVFRREAYGLVQFVELTKLSVGVLDLTRHFGVALYRVIQQEERSLRFRQSALRLAMLRQTAEVINGLELDSVLAKLMELCRRTVNADAGCIAMREPGSEAMLVRVDLGFGDEHLQNLLLQDGTVLADLVATEKVICLVKPDEPFDEFQPTAALENINSLVAVPLHTRLESRGCVVLINPKEADPDHLKLLTMVIDLCSSAIDNAVLHVSMLEKEVLRGQLEIAGSIQNNLLPSHSPILSGASFAGRSVSCDESGGDFYDCLRSENGDITFVLGDATGHGVGAALVATTVRALLRAKLGPEPACGIDLASILTEVNELAEMDLPDDRFMTLVIGQYECASKKLSWASAGHDPGGIVLRAATATEEVLESTGLPLGMFAQSEYTQGRTIQLAAGDVILLMTDGITEAENSSGNQYGADRVAQVLAKGDHPGADGLVEDLVADVFSFIGDAEQKDDITLLCLMVNEERRVA